MVMEIQMERYSVPLRSRARKQWRFTHDRARQTVGISHRMSATDKRQA